MGPALLLDPMRGALSEPDPQVGALFQNPMMARQVAAMRAANARPDVTDLFGYGPDWGSYLANLQSNIQQQYPIDPSQVQRGALNAALAVGPQMTVFHGSPHSFTKFDMSKVGTGEGSTAYGHGLYFAENPKVAGQYATDLKGQTYRVDLPDEHIAKMIDWDKPIKDQPKLQEIAKQLGIRDRVNIAERPDLGDYHYVDAVGADLVDAVIEKFGKEGATEFFRQSGIPGIRYLDLGSRSGGAGTSNFVVFDDNLPKILGRE